MADYDVETLRLNHHQQHGYDSYFGCSEAPADCAMELEYSTSAADQHHPHHAVPSDNHHGNSNNNNMQFLEPVQAQFYIPSKGRMSSWKPMYIWLSRNGFSVFHEHDHSCFLSFCFGTRAAAHQQQYNTIPTLVANPTRLRTTGNHNGCYAQQHEQQQGGVVEVTMQLDAAYYGDECDDTNSAIPIRIRQQPGACNNNNNNSVLERFLQHLSVATDEVALY